MPTLPPELRMRNTWALLISLIWQTHGVLGNPRHIQCINCNWPTGQEYFEHPYDCTKFYHCSPSGPQEKQCALGTRWDQQLLVCNHAFITPCVVGAYTYLGGACHPSGCYFGNKMYSDEEDIEESCMKLICKKGQWNYIAQIHPYCRFCTAHGEPHFGPFNKHTYSPIRDEGLYNFQTPGTYIMTQPGIKNQEEFVVYSEFVICNKDPVLTCVISTRYIEPGIEVSMTLPDAQHCTDGNPNCVIKVNVTGVPTPIGKSVETFEGDDGTILVFDNNHYVDNTALNCMNIVGTKGVSVSLCTYDNDYAWVWVFAMESLENKVYGLCDAYNDTTLNGYTKRDGSVVEGYTQDEINEFAESWAEGPVDKSIKRLSSWNKCTNATVSNEMNAVCKYITWDICKEDSSLCAYFLETCVFDLCHVSNPYRYAQGYASHILVHRHLTSAKCCGLWLKPIPCCTIRPHCC